MRTVLYGGYTINSVPTKDAETDQWQLRISISWEKNGSKITRPFWTPMGYPTEMEADVHGITFGQRIIDGKIPGISVSE
jgi:hypothetical protein